MSLTYIYLEKLSEKQRDAVDKFNKNKKINYNKTLCEICNSQDFTIIFKNDRYGINQKTCFCNLCGFVFSNPRMTEESSKYFYNSDLYRILYDGITDNFTEEDLYNDAYQEIKNYKPQKPKKPNFAKYYENLYFDFINYHIEDFKTVLDIGTGKGKKLIDFLFIGKKAEGIEPSKTFNKLHTAYGLNSKVGFLNDINNEYDLVMLSHVFEHLTSLNEVVSKLEKITKKYLFIEVPGHLNHLQSIQNAHNFYFSSNTLNHFILNHNFKLIKLEYVKDNEFILAIYEKIDEKNNYKFNYKNEKKIIRKIYKKYLIRYIWNSIFIKFLKLSKTDEIIRKLYRNIKNLF